MTDSYVNLSVLRSAVADKAIERIEAFRRGESHGIDVGTHIEVLLRTSFKLEESWMLKQKEIPK